MTDEKTTHALAPPWHLPGERDEQLTDFLRDEAWGQAVTLLRDVVTSSTTEPKWLILLAYARFRDVCEVMLDERLEGAREALNLIEAAVAAGADLNELTPFRTEVEKVLDQETRAELAVLAALPPEGESLASVPLELLSEGAHRLWASEGKRAASLFLEIARRLKSETPDTSVIASIRAGLCLDAAGQFEEAKPLLELALTADWSLPHLRDERSLAETALTALLGHAEGQELEALWLMASVLGERMGLPFPSIWPNQETLLARLTALREMPKARLVASRIEETRELLPRALSEAIASVRL